MRSQSTLQYSRAHACGAFRKHVWDFAFRAGLSRRRRHTTRRGGSPLRALASISYNPPLSSQPLHIPTKPTHSSESLP